MNFSNLNGLLLVFLISFVLVLSCYYILKKIKKIDLNLTSLSDQKNVITSLGLSFTLCIFLISIIFYLNYDLAKYLPNRFYLFYISIIILTVLSFLDDTFEVDPKLKLIIQLCVVYFSLTNLELLNLGLPLKLSMFFCLLFWVYIINIINFIDGSDGHCAVHSISFLLGIIIISYYFNIQTFGLFISIILFSALIFFMFLNYPRAKAYMGDTGSIVLGYSIGYVSLEFILIDKLFYILTLLSYPLLDCTITLIKKTSKGYYPWAKLSDYFFLIPIKKKQLHKKVFYTSIIINIINLSLLILMLNNFNIIFFILSLINSIVFILYYNSYNNEK